jgi:hypothetical protein
MGILSEEKDDGELSEGRGRLETTSGASAAPSVFIGACGVAPTAPSSAPPCPSFAGQVRSICKCLARRSRLRLKFAFCSDIEASGPSGSV